MLPSFVTELLTKTCNNEISEDLITSSNINKERGKNVFDIAKEAVFNNKNKAVI